MLDFVSVVFFILGAIIASFIGVVVARLNTGQSLVSDRSRCDACDKILPASALVPIVSYCATEGRAVCCGARLSYYAPITEALLGGLFVLAYSVVGFTALLPFILVSFSLLLALVLYDLSHQILPPSLLAAFVVTAATVGFLSAASDIEFWSTLLTALLIGASLSLIYVFSAGRAMGFSDTPLSFGLSLLVGPAAFPGFIFSFWIGAVIGVLILLKRPPGTRMRVEVPFAPFLALGFLLAYFTQWNPFAFVATLPLH
jgi:prepilin signal peptidase PulO-like enzyme (type II secretory pathway)